MLLFECATQGVPLAVLHLALNTFWT